MLADREDPELQNAIAMSLRSGESERTLSATALSVITAECVPIEQCWIGDGVLIADRDGAITGLPHHVDADGDFEDVKIPQQLPEKAAVSSEPRAAELPDARLQFAEKAPVATTKLEQMILLEAKAVDPAESLFTSPTAQQRQAPQREVHRVASKKGDMKKLTVPPVPEVARNAEPKGAEIGQQRSLPSGAFSSMNKEQPTVGFSKANAAADSPRGPTAGEPGSISNAEDGGQRRVFGKEASRANPECSTPGRLGGVDNEGNGHDEAAILPVLEALPEPAPDDQSLDEPKGQEPGPSRLAQVSFPKGQDGEGSADKRRSAPNSPAVASRALPPLPSEGAKPDSEGQEGARGLAPIPDSTILYPTPGKLEKLCVILPCKVFLCLD